MVYKEKFFDCYECQKKVSEWERVRCFVENQVPRIPAKSFHKECFFEGTKKQGITIKCRMCKKEIANANFKCGVLTGVYYHNECYKKIGCGGTGGWSIEQLEKNLKK